jgi:hypothetical protein
MGAFLMSALVNALLGFAAMLPYGVVVGLAMAAAFIMQGNFSNLTSGVLAARNQVCQDKPAPLATGWRHPMQAMFCTGHNDVSTGDHFCTPTLVAVAHQWAKVTLRTGAWPAPPWRPVSLVSVRLDTRKPTSKLILTELDLSEVRAL